MAVKNYKNWMDDLPTYDIAQSDFNESVYNFKLGDKEVSARVGALRDDTFSEKFQSDQLFDIDPETLAFRSLALRDGYTGLEIPVTDEIRALIQRIYLHHMFEIKEISDGVGDEVDGVYS